MNTKLSNMSKLSFGLGAFGKDLAYAIVGNYLMMYFTDMRMIDPIFVGSLFMFARVWDAFNDPFMGMVVDNTRTKWGKFRPWMLIGTVLNSVVIVFLFLDIQLSDSAYLVYCSVFYILWGMTYTIMDIPYWSMVPALTTDEDERSQIVAIPRIFASCAWLVVGSFGLTFIRVFGQGDDLKGMATFALLVSVVFVITIIITCLNVKEAEIDQSQEKVSVKQMIGVLVKNDQVKVILGIALFFNLGYQLSNSFALYYFGYVVGNRDLYSVYTGVAGIAQMASLAAFPKFSKIVGKGRAFFLASFLPVIGFILLLTFGFVAPTNSFLIGVASAVINTGIGFMLVLVTVMLAEVVDYGEYKLGTRNESIVFSMQTLIVKFAGAFSGFISGVGLSMIGYVANETQSDTTIMGMRVIMIVIPSILSALCFVVYKKSYILTPEFCAQMNAKLKAKVGSDDVILEEVQVNDDDNDNSLDNDSTEDEPVEV